MTPIKTFLSLNPDMLTILEPHLLGGYLIQYSLFTEFDLVIPEPTDVEYHEWLTKQNPTCYYIHTNPESGFKTIRLGVNLADAQYEELLRLKEIGGMSISFGTEGFGRTKTINPHIVQNPSGNILYLIKK